MDWGGWATFGFAATVALTATSSALNSRDGLAWTSPMMLGTIFVEDPDRARVVGAFVHLVNGQLFAILYAAAFWQLGRSGWWLGGLFGALHGVAALTLIIPLLPGIHPRMASPRQGPEGEVILEPPGLLGLNYGRATAGVTLGAHVV